MKDCLRIMHAFFRAFCANFSGTKSALVLIFMLFVFLCWCYLSCGAGPRKDLDLHRPADKFSKHHVNVSVQVESVAQLDLIITPTKKYCTATCQYRFRLSLGTSSTEFSIQVPAYLAFKIILNTWIDFKSVVLNCNHWTNAGRPAPDVSQIRPIGLWPG